MLMYSMPVTFIVVKGTVILPMWILRPMAGHELHPPCTQDCPSTARSSLSPADCSTAPRGAHLPFHSAPRGDQSLHAQSCNGRHCLPPPQGTPSGTSQGFTPKTGKRWPSFQLQGSPHCPRECLPRSAPTMSRALGLLQPHTHQHSRSPSFPLLLV